MGLAVVLVLLSCSNGAKDYALTSEDEHLVRMLCEIHIAEAAAAKFPKMDRDSVHKAFLNEIFHIHRIPKEKYDSTMNVIRKDAPRFLKIYESVTDSIKLKKPRSR